MSSPILTGPVRGEGAPSLLAILLLGVGMMAFFAGLAVIEAATVWGAVLVGVAVLALAAAGLVGVRRALPRL